MRGLAVFLLLTQKAVQICDLADLDKFDFDQAKARRITSDLGRGRER